MKKTIVVFCFLIGLFLISSAVAGTPTTQKGSASIFYTFNGLDGLCVDNTWLGVQYLLFNKGGVGMDFCFSYDREKLDDDDEPESNSGFGIDAFIIYYPVQKGSVALWVSPDIGLSFSSQKDKDIDMKCTSTDFWMGASLGVEWWLFDQVSLSASNWFGLEYYVENNDINNVKTKPKDFSLGLLGSSSSKFIISFYFK